MAFFAGAATPTSGAELRLELERERVRLGELFDVEVRIIGKASGVSPPELDLGGHFVVVSGPTARDVVTIVGGRRKEGLRYRFTLRPLREGIFDVGPAYATSAGRPLRSKTARVQVQAGGSPSASKQGSDAWDVLFEDPSDRALRQRRRGKAASGTVMLLASLDRSEVYVGQKVTYTLELLARRAVTTANSRSESQFAGFWTEPQEVSNSPRPTSKRHDGRKFESYLLRRVELYPTHEGKLRIGPAIWDVKIRINDFLYTDEQEITRSSQPLELTVLPLPQEDRPQGFRGAVGRFEISAALDREVADAGESLLLTVTLSGSGNLGSAPAPVLPDFLGLRLYDSNRDRSSAEVDEKTRQWEFALVAKAPGRLILEGIEYPYFDPSLDRYRIARAGPLQVTIERGDGRAVSAAFAARVKSTGASARRDIAYLKLAVDGLGSPVEPLYQRSGLWLLLSLPVLANLVVWCGLWLRRRDPAEPASNRRSRALKTAQKRLKAASRQRSDGPARVATRVSEALFGYLADRFDTASAGLTHDRIRVLLADQVERERVDGLLRLLSRLDYLQFTPAGGRGDDIRRILKEAKGRLKRLDRVLRQEAAS